MVNGVVLLLLRRQIIKRDEKSRKLTMNLIMYFTSYYLYIYIDVAFKINSKHLGKNN